MALRAQVKASKNTNALVDLEVYNSAGQLVHQRFWDNQGFRADRGRTFSSSWTVPAKLPPGTYTVKVGVFAPGWVPMFAWNNSAATFTVR